jgi:hypothetical protein
MTGRPSRDARLGEIEQRGYLEIRTDGYHRCEGAFFCPLSERERITRFMIEGRPVLFRGTLYHEKRTELVERPVLIGGFTAEGGQLRVRLIGGPPESRIRYDARTDRAGTDAGTK